MLSDSTSGLQVNLLEVKLRGKHIRILFREHEVSSSQTHPNTFPDIILDETHALNTLRRVSSMRNPELLTGAPGQIEIASGAHLSMRERPHGQQSVQRIRIP